MFAGDCGQIRRIKFDQPDNGHYLEGHVFLNLSISTKRQCEEQCLMQQECVSVNIGPPVNEKFFCELSDSDHVQHSRDLKRRCNWTYRGIEVWFVFLNKTKIIKRVLVMVVKKTKTPKT